MTFFSSKLIVLLLLVVTLEITSSKNRTILRSELPKKVQTIKHSYVNLLNSLIKVNQERVAALKKLYVLNSITYGKDGLRSTIENKLEDYDIMEERLKTTLKHILDNLKQEPKAAIDENDINEILRTNDHIFVIPNETDNHKEIETTDQQERNKVKKALRNKDSDDDSSKERSNDKSDSKDDSKSNEESLNEVKNNGTQGRSYFYEYGCGRGRIRCIKACKEAYRYACDYYYCRSSLRDELRSSCKIECRAWFY